MEKTDVQWLREYADARFDAINTRMSDAEQKRIEMLTTLRESNEKSEKTLDTRLDAMNHFRTQILSERLSYVTKEQLYLIIKGLISFHISAIIVLMTAAQIIIHVFWK